MSGTSNRLHTIREKWAARRQERRVTKGERELRRAEARARRHSHATFDEGRRDPGGGSGI